MGHRDRAQGGSEGSEKGLHPEPKDQPKLAQAELPGCLAPTEARGPGFFQSPPCPAAGGPGAG